MALGIKEDELAVFSADDKHLDCLLLVECFVDFRHAGDVVLVDVQAMLLRIEELHLLDDVFK